MERTSAGSTNRIRPLSALSLLADRLDQSTTLDDNDDAIEWRNSRSSESVEQRPMSEVFEICDSNFVPNSDHNLLSSSVPSMLYTPSNLFHHLAHQHSDPCYASLAPSPPHIPPKRHCRSLSSTDSSIARPIARHCLHSPLLNSTNLSSQTCSDKPVDVGNTRSALFSLRSDGDSRPSTPKRGSHHKLANRSVSPGGAKLNWLVSRPAGFNPSSIGLQTSTFLCAHHLQNHLHHHKMTKASPGGSFRPLISPSFKNRSAFTPTRPLVSPQTSSDYSLSPDVDSPVQRPASVSSGFHESSVQSLVEACSLPDCSQSCRHSRTSTTPVVSRFSHPTGASSVTAGSANKPRVRCRSQPSLHASPSSMQRLTAPWCYQCLQEKSRPLITLNTQPLKRRRGTCTNICGRTQTPVISGNHPDVPHIPVKQIMPICPNDNSSSEVFFFGSSRPYLVSLPRIASSPTPGCSRPSHPVRHKASTLSALQASQMASCMAGQGPPLSSSGGRGSQASTLTASSTGTPTNSMKEMSSSCGAVNCGTQSGGLIAMQEPSSTDSDLQMYTSPTDDCTYDSAEDDDMEEGIEEEEEEEMFSCVATNPSEEAYAAESPASSSEETECCFRPVSPPSELLQMSKSSSQILPFQELDLDQIEND